MIIYSKFVVDNRWAIEKLASAFFDNLTEIDGEYGGIGIDCKRPFGNSDVEGDILELLGEEPMGDDGEDACWSFKQRDYAKRLYIELLSYLKKRYGSSS